MRRSFIISSLALVTALWASLLVAAPASYNAKLSAATYAAGALVCHQRPERSFHLGNAQLPVCARCLGLYAGAILGVAAWAGFAGVHARPSLRAQRFASSHRLRWMLALLALPTLLTVATALGGVWDPPNATRAVLAMPLGAAIAAIVTAVATGDLR